ncbi:MAG: corrinoid protein [Anaerolineae bacterium]|nr:corrinoid protein [Anaerolineae bacterium]
MSVLEDIRASVIKGDAAGTRSSVDQALAEGIAASTILNDALISAMAEVGERFEQGEFYIPEMLIAARAMQTGLEPLKPLLVESGAEPLGRVVIGTVQGDLHDIGKNLVAMMLEGAGFEIVDLGTNTPPANFVQAVNDGAQIVAMSALLTTTMPAMKTTIEALEAAGMRDKIKVMVGGAPVTQAYAEQIGADGFSADASSAVRMAKQLLGV